MVPQESVNNPAKNEAGRGQESLHLHASTPALESPSLTGSAGLEIPAYELKFLLTQGQAKEVEARIGDRLEPDPHADPALGNAYQTTSLYCDTAQYDVFHRLGSCKRRKHRVRRYGDAPWIYLERKIKWADRVKKLRSVVPLTELAELANPMSATTWSGHWFHRHLVGRQLRPVCTIVYDRVVLMGRVLEGPMRVTFDRNIRGVLTKDWALGCCEDGLPILTDQVVCEFKYQAFLPALFKEVIQEMHLSPRPVSKYRTFLRALGHGAARGSVDV